MNLKTNIIEIGMRFGKLLVISSIKKKNGHRYCDCRCDCGIEKSIRVDHLRGGKIVSCGCKKIAECSRIGKLGVKHGKSKTRLYGVFRDMKTRCYNPNSSDFKYYGGRGIKICDEWLKDYTKFEKWSISNGYDENAKKMSCTIDRIDVNGNYCPENCRWVGADIQNRNKRKNTGEA